MKNRTFFELIKTELRGIRMAAEILGCNTQEIENTEDKYGIYAEIPYKSTIKDESEMYLGVIKGESEEYLSIVVGKTVERIYNSRLNKSSVIVDIIKELVPRVYPYTFIIFEKIMDIVKHYESHRWEDWYSKDYNPEDITDYVVLEKDRGDLINYFFKDAISWVNRKTTLLYRLDAMTVCGKDVLLAIIPRTPPTDEPRLMMDNMKKIVYLIDKEVGENICAFYVNNEEDEEIVKNSEHFTYNLELASIYLPPNLIDVFKELGFTSVEGTWIKPDKEMEERFLITKLQ